jgi:hypothetical protein
MYYARHKDHLFLAADNSQILATLLGGTVAEEKLRSQVEGIQHRDLRWTF